MELPPEIRDLYQKLPDEIFKFGKVVIEEKKTSFYLKSKSAFAGVQPRENYFILNIVFASSIKSPRVIKQEQVSKNRFHNEVKIEKIEDIDNELLKWLKDAYVLTA
jgi:hypothetical protein